MFNFPFAKEIDFGFYPERLEENTTPLEQFIWNCTGFFKDCDPLKNNRGNDIVRQVEKAGDSLQNINDDQLHEELLSFKKELRTGKLDKPHAIRSFALIREYSARKIGMRHYNSQLIGGWAMLSGTIAEMETGEGKTLAATLPAATVALAGVPVHVITVNDYLAKRDAEWMAPLYESLGLSVGTIISGMALEKRREAYLCDITYCSNKEVAFDYLKDRLKISKKPGPMQVRLEKLQSRKGPLDSLLMRGLCFAIVDEADSILIDEARTPLIISGQGNNSYEIEIYEQALNYAQALDPQSDFLVNETKNNVEISKSGKSKLAKICKDASGFWQGTFRREETIRLALSALHLFELDREYLVRDGKVQIVDEYTGRVMKDRSWERGLHQLIEAKEGCKITPQRETLARISYQRFFRRYLHLAGMTGTAKEVAAELWSVFGLQIMKIPTQKKLARQAHRARFFKDSEQKWTAVVEKIEKMHAKGRPVLVGTRSVAASEHISNLLTGAGMEHQVLNARQNEEEAAKIAEAGKHGRITVATNMAGRGTDIILSDAARQNGGLHVIATERHAARRIDRQLFGRCGRQGDPGSYELFCAADDEIIDNFCPTILKKTAALMAADNPFCQWLVNQIATHAQKKVEKTHFQTRKQLMRFDESMENMLAFSGVGE